MKMFNKGLLTVGMLLIAFLMTPNFSNAQTPPEDPGGDPDAPIDGGVSLLVAAGVGYGIKKVRDNRKKNVAQF